MSLSGSVNSATSVGGSYVRLDWSATQNYSANTSTITATLYLVLNGGTSVSGTHSGNITIDGVVFNYSFSASYGPNGTYQISTATQTVTHNTDGTRSVTISASYNQVYLGTLTCSGTWSLDTIPRYATITGATITSNDVSVSASITTDTICDTISMSLDNGATYPYSTVIDFTSASITSSLNLPSETTYNGYISVKRKDSQLLTYYPFTITTAQQNRFLSILL